MGISRFASLVVLGGLHLSSQSVGSKQWEKNWLRIATGGQGSTIVFIDPKTVQFDKSIPAWTCWVRFVIPENDLEEKSRYALRKNGEEVAFLSVNRFSIRDGKLISSANAQPGSLIWEQVIPGSLTSAIWESIQVINKQKRQRK